jgi:methionine synthase / methylenetetrahydrofolate reductase(NADPH)
MKKPFRERLKEGPVLCDGAMGTVLDLYEYDELPHEIQNIKNPDIVERIHRDYIEAGSELIETNTFSANRFRLAEYHVEDKIGEINLKGVEIAKRAADNKVYVAGAIGPTGKLLEPIGKIKKQEVRDAFREQAEYLLEGGVDLIMLETFVSTQELDEAIEAVKGLADIPLVAQKAFAEDGAILSSSYPVEVIEHLIEKGVDIVGANCTVGPQRMFSIIRSIHKDGVILIAQPAAGIPTLQDGRSIYHTSPEYLATYARELIESGVTLIGACCGSTPAHIKAIAKAIKNIKVGKAEPKPPEKSTFTVKSGPEPMYNANKFKRSKFARGVGNKLLTSVELEIPRGVDMSPVLEGAQKLFELDIDAVNITDGARARLRMSPFAVSQLIQQKVGIETITHMATRDRNMISLQAELLGANATGIKNLLCITGDPTHVGDYPQATSVFDIDSIGLIRAASSMNRGVDLMGHTIGEPTSFLIACAANPKAFNMEREIERLEMKAEAGAEFIFTQPLFEMQTLEEFIKKIEHLHLPVMLGILPLRSYRHADFLHNEVPGINIPEIIREKIRAAGKEAAKAGIQLSKDFLKNAKHLVQGVYMMPPFSKYNVINELLEVIR